MPDYDEMDTPELIMALLGDIARLAFGITMLIVIYFLAQLLL